MDPITASLMIGSSIFSIFGQLSAGKAKQREAELNAYGIETERLLGKSQAEQLATARLEEYDQASSANIALFAAAGRDIGADRSVKAFMDKQKEIIGTDLGRMQKQSQIEGLRSRQQAAAERANGRSARTASLFAAAETATSGLTKYRMAR